MKTSGEDVEQAKDLLVWARENQFSLHTIQVGSVVLTVSDARPIKEAKERLTKLADPRSLYQEYADSMGIDMEQDSAG